MNDGTTTKTVSITGPFNTGAWMHVPISVQSGGSVLITVDKVAGGNAVISGLFLGGAGTPPVQPPPPYEPGVQGSWVGTYGVDGYVLGGWTGSADLAALPNATLSLEQGTRFLWTTTTDVRGLTNPAQTERRASTIYHATQVRLRLNFTQAYTGTLHLYALDWDTSSRRENVTVNDGTTTKTVSITGPFNTGAWMHVPISVQSGGSVLITVDKVAGGNAVISGLFLGGAGTPPVPPPDPGAISAESPGVQGDWVGHYGSDGYVLGGWYGDSDLKSLPLSTLVVQQGARHAWTGTSSAKALSLPDQSARRSAALYHATQLQLRLDFAAPYTGTLHLYLLDWDTTARREKVTVVDGSGARSYTTTAAFDKGLWLHVPVTVSGGGSISITVDRLAGTNAVLAGLFLGSGLPRRLRPRRLLMSWNTRRLGRRLRSRRVCRGGMDRDR